MVISTIVTRIVIAGGRLQPSGGAAENADLYAGFTSYRDGVGVNILERGRRPPLRFRQRQPQLQDAHLTASPDVLAVDDSPPGGHPLHFACVNHAAFVAIVDRTLQDQGDGFKPRVRVRPTQWTIPDIHMVVGKHDERVVQRELVRRHDLRGEVPGADKSLERAVER